jgi:hypothetical protein
MKSIEVDIEPLRTAIRKHGLMKAWQDGLFVKSVTEGKYRARKWAIEE